MWRGLGLSALALVCAVVLLGWNLHRFIGAESKIRAKQLDFLPAPVVAELLCLGHRNSVAKLRWIDSFAYFEYLLDRRDDRVGGGGEGGFKRLYDTLITLDPSFQPFYEHGALSASGILGRHGEALGFLLRGLDANPQRTELWRNAAVMLKVFFHWQERSPRLFDAFLAEWEAAEPTPEGKRMVWDWKRNMARTTFSDLEQLPYWLNQLKGAIPGTPGSDYIEATIREQLADFGTRQLQALAGAYRVAHGGKAEHLSELCEGLPLADPLALLDPAAELNGSAQPRRLEDLLDPALVRAHFPHGLPPFGPLQVVDGRLVVRSDPFGLPWRIERGRVISGGIERRTYERYFARLNAQLLNAARERGSWPRTLAELEGYGIEVADLPPGCTLQLAGQSLVGAWRQQPERPWPLR